MRRRLLASTALAVVTTLGLSGCSLGGWVYNANLPGGADLGKDPLTVKARFSDVLDLVPQSSVKVDNVSVGRVESIALADDGRSALVTLEVQRSTNLPEGTTARLEQTSLLGEKYVALVPPSGDAATTVAAPAPLRDGETLPLGDTSEAADVEEVLGALSLVLNGGGIGQFHEISQQLQKISDGRTGQIRDFLTQTDRFVSSLNQRRGDITSALDGLDRLSRTLKDNDQKISTTLEGLSPGLKVLAQQTPQLTRMLKALNRLSTVTVTTLNRSQKQMIADFKELDPILTKLAESGQDLPNSLQILLTYPFPDSVLGDIKGDYLNTFMTTNFRTVPAGCAGEGCAWPQVGSGSADASTTSRGIPPTATDTETSPTLLPPTDTPTPGATTPTVPAPSILPGTPDSSPSGTAGGSPSGTSTSPSGTTSGSSSATPSGSDTPSETGSPTDTGSPSTAPDPTTPSGSAESKGE